MHNVLTVSILFQPLLIIHCETVLVIRVCFLKKSQYVCIAVADHAEERIPRRAICRQATVRTTSHFACSLGKSCYWFDFDCL